MTDPNVQPGEPDRERRRAADLRTGDRIVPGDLIGATVVEEVLFVRQYSGDGTPKVAVVVRPIDVDRIFIHYWRVDLSVALASTGAEVPAGVEGVAPGAAIGRATVPEACNGDPCTLFHRHPHPAS